MIEVGGIYKLKKLNLPYIHNDNDSYEILYEINPNIVACINTNTRERMILQKQFFIDPEKPDEDSFEGMTIEPTILEEFGGGMAATSAGSAGGAIGGMASLGAAPCPTMAQASNGVSGAMVNGIPVEGQSAMKKKKKKKKKNEELQLVAPADPDIQFGDTYFAHTEQDVFNCLDKMIPGDARGVFLKHKEYDETCELTIEMLDEDLYKLSLEEDTEENSNDWEGKGVMDTDAITKEDAILVIQSLLSDYKVVTNKVDEKVESIINDLLEDFNEEYEEITEQIAKYLDRLNFQYANTTDIVYKKEGDYKYLFKFDNEIGIIKIKVLKGDEVLVEKTYEIDETQDVQPIFDEIESIYNQYGV